MVTSSGLKMTPQRRAIVNYLQDATNHPTADEVLQAVNEAFPMTSRATVYNTLHWLTEAGLVREVYEGAMVRYDPNTDRHHHFVCRGCGKVEDIISTQSGDLLSLSVPNDYQVENLEITFRGLCPDCKT
ncbi:MAG: transcriptional repressor [Acidobacteria bacterium]|nr:transcriptional repressor [Acidobacteriota bacterium]